MAVVVNMGLAQVLVLSVFVGQVRVRDSRVVVLVSVHGGEVLPLAQYPFGALAAVMGHVRVLVGVHYRLMRVLLEVPQMGVLDDLEFQR
ncbi:MAG TPA: hypothetical protein VNN10_05275 [Dehalococcoidia bacterium]|nr:hypothetical protein [Dehalococcoidia bacterium]